MEDPVVALNNNEIILRNDAENIPFQFCSYSIASAFYISCLYCVKCGLMLWKRGE